MRLGAVARERRVLLRGGRPGRCLDAALSSLLDPRKIFGDHGRDFENENVTA